MDLLREDQRNLELQLEESIADEIVKRRLAKRLDYVRSCLTKAQRDCEAQELSAQTTQEVSERVFVSARAAQLEKPTADPAVDASIRSTHCKSNGVLTSVDN